MSQSDPRRLLDDSAAPEHHLLAAWSSMRAPDAARAGAVALLGATAAATGAAVAGASVGAGASGASVGAGASGSVGSAAAGAGTSAGGVVAPMALASKLVIIAAVTVALAGSTLLLRTGLFDPSAASEVARPHEALPRATSLPPLDVPSLANANEPVLVADPVGALPSAPPSASSAGIVAPSPTSPSASVGAREATTAPTPEPSLGAQLAELEAIRGALAAHDYDAALGSLDRFSAHHPGSPLAAEAAALRFDAQLARGDRAAAGETARRFLRVYPESPYAARIRRASSNLP